MRLLGDNVSVGDRGRWTLGRVFRVKLIPSVCFLVMLVLPRISVATDVLSGDVFAHVQAFKADLETLRSVTGAPRVNALELKVRGASPYEVYVQARTLFRKADRLSFEITRVRHPEPGRPQDGIAPADVLTMVRRAREAVHGVMAELDVGAVGALPEADATKTPTDVFRAILSANRQLNLLLERRFSPSDVYMEVTVAIGYAAQLLARYPVAIRIPDPPPFVPAKEPSDVYLRLLACLKIVAGLLRDSGLEAMTIDASEALAENVTPSDVFDMASLVVAQLDVLHRHSQVGRMPREGFQPGRKFPSHVYQQASILKLQLEELARLSGRP